MDSSKYFVNIPTNGAGNLLGEKHYDDDDWDARHRTRSTWYYSNGHMHMSKYPGPPSLHQSSTRSAADDQKMEININDMNGKIFKLDVLPSDTIDMVKKKIQDSEKIPKDKQQLVYMLKRLNDKHTLEYYNIHKFSTLAMYNALREHKMQIYILGPSGDVITLHVLPSDTIEVVKQKIQDCEKIPKDKQNLYYVHLKLRDSHTLKAYNINNMSILRLSET